MKNEDLGLEIATAMDNKLKSEEYEKLFNKGAALAKVAHLRAVAEGDVADAKDGCKCTKTNCKRCENCKGGCDCENASDANDADVANVEDADMASDLQSVTAAIKFAVNGLNKVSEVLDGAGLERTASISLSLINAIIVEAKKKAKLSKEDKEKAKEKAEKDKNDAKAKSDKAKAKAQAEKDKAAAAKEKEKAAKEKFKEKAEKDKNDAKAKTDKDKEKANKLKEKEKELKKK